MNDPKPSDYVKVVFADDHYEVRGTLVKISSDGKNVEIRTDKGGIMIGIPKTIEVVKP